MPHPPRFSRGLAPLAPPVALLAVVLALAACAASTMTARGPVSASSPSTTKPLAATSTPSPTLTTVPVRCGNTPLPTPYPSGPTAAGQFVGWDGVPALPGTLIYSDEARASDGVQTSTSSEALGLCTPAITPDAVSSFYVTQLVTYGWATTPTFFPPTSTCTGTCWMRDAGGGTTSYLALDHLQAADNSTLYILTRFDVHLN
jgi:hypothetical protein